MEKMDIIHLTDENYPGIQCLDAFDGRLEFEIPACEGVTEEQLGDLLEEL